MLVKICGIKNQETLLCCEKNSVNFFGMIFYKKSPRNIEFEEAKFLKEQSEKLEINSVGVFVNKEINQIIDYIKNLKLNFVQLHGNEDDFYIKKLKDLNIKVIKKISIKISTDLNQVNDYKNADYFLFDYKPNKNELPGGNSKSFDWNIIKNLKINKPWFLSGGINLENINSIIREIKPFGVDLSSGVEKELGIKDNHIINNFMEKINNA
ncbi:MAG: hypothetical protein CBD97_01830 [Pelagibacteraceae bacterium TMED237]|nr:MAG: hypothetical protein CBD97_01830 [Pelagibacteraceae bacterium TMED237]|tara:strand:- start:5046 stop:5675 length:630 start_codon:yes stop_codon:yes gene_type:complete